jgi:hypothetical protein
VNEELERLIEEKKKNDHRQRKTTLLVIVLSVVGLIIILLLVTKKQKQNETLVQHLDSASAVVSQKDSDLYKLNKTLIETKKENKADLIECVGTPTGTKTASGLPKYNFTIRIKGSPVIAELDSVEYFFNDPSYNPMRKKTKDSKMKFSIYIPNSWGCMPIVPVYLYYKDRHTDTVLFPMCDKSRISLPRIGS